MTVMTVRYVGEKNCVLAMTSYVILNLCIILITASELSNASLVSFTNSELSDSSSKFSLENIRKKIHSNVEKLNKNDKFEIEVVI